MCLAERKIITCVKKFYSIQLKQHKENIPPALAETMLLDESRLVKYLWNKKALHFSYPKGRHRLDLYADEKYLMLGKLKHGAVFESNKRIGFMELYIAHRINQRMNLSRGSS